ncbi:MAG: ABC transporter permease [Opitutaceae bacterium]|nr:ABC transporter permease [Opitutaceae bacterium]|tara:strand:- start:94 stop:1287 length:1194 start_codon:yes stop_codon:yes gene_type:complete
MIMSLTGIVFGVGFFIFGQAQTTGYQQFFIDTILGTDGAIRVQDRIRETFTTMELEAEDGTSWIIENTENYKHIGGIEHPLEVIQALKNFESVTGVSEVVSGRVDMISNYRTYPARIYGVHLDDHLAVSDLEDQIIFGDLQDFRAKPTGILIGSTLVRRLQVNLGETVIVDTLGKKNRYTIAGIFQTGVSDIDQERVFMNISEARSVLQKPHGASFLQVNLVDHRRATEEALRMANTIYHSVTSWQQRQKSWLDAFVVLRVSTGLTIATIILLSGLGMFNTLAMLVLEKTKEIAILRSMGYTRRDISSIFLWQGVIVLLVGNLLGWILAAGITYGVSKLPFRVTGIFSTDSFIVYWSIWHYLLATVAAAVIVIVASYIPAQRAARLEPGDIIRGTSQ